MSHSTIYYFSATGNSFNVARTIADKINASLVRITTDTDIHADGDVLGFVFPSYFMGIPGLVNSFVQKLQISNASYLFAVVTCGRISNGALGQFDSLLHSKGLKLNYANTVYTVANYICEYDINLEKVGIQLEKAASQATKISEDIANRTCKKILSRSILSKITYRQYLSKYPKQDQFFPYLILVLAVVIASESVPQRI